MSFASPLPGRARRAFLRFVVLASLAVSGMGWFAVLELTGCTANIVAWGVLSAFGGSVQPLYDSTPHMLVYQAFEGSGSEAGEALGVGLLLPACTRLHRILLRAENVEAECRLFLARLGFGALVAGVAALIANVMLVTLDRTRLGPGYFWEYVTVPVPDWAEMSLYHELALVPITTSVLLALIALRAIRWLRSSVLVPLALASVTAATWAVLPDYQGHIYLCRLGSDEHVTLLNWLALALLVLPTIVVLLLDRRHPPIPAASAP